MLQKPVTILVVDDDQSVRNMLSIILKKEGYRVEEAEGGGVALKKLKSGSFDLVISDIKMPDINGIDMLKKIKAIVPELPVIMITAFASTNDAVEAMKQGAEDYVMKPFNLDELRIIIRRSLDKVHIVQENLDLREKLTEKKRFKDIVGTNPKMVKIFEIIDTIAQTDSTVLITGESGTGKELIARAIHNKGRRENQKFVSINCGALPENLLESELFGHKKGAFTDAYQDKEGLFELADKGTLFLDEIAEMSQNMQVKLLRAIQERIIRRVGGNLEIKIDVRIIAATNQNLAASIQNGDFRKDLYYRLNVISIEVPPLRHRREDIPVLMNYFLAQYNQVMNKNISGFSTDVSKLFLQYPWPGNVRELENFIERAVALEKGDYIGLNSLPAELVYHLPEGDLAQDDWKVMLQNRDFNFSSYIDSISRKIILGALEMNEGNLKRTADSLKLNYRSLRYLIEKYSLKIKG